MPLPTSTTHLQLTITTTTTTTVILIVTITTAVHLVHHAHHVLLVLHLNLSTAALRLTSLISQTTTPITVTTHRMATVTAIFDDELYELCSPAVRELQKYHNSDTAPVSILRHATDQPATFLLIHAAMEAAGLEDSHSVRVIIQHQDERKQFE